MPVGPVAPISAIFGCRRQPLPFRRRPAVGLGRGPPHDVGLDHNVVSTTNHHKMFDIVAADEDDASFSVDRQSLRLITAYLPTTPQGPCITSCGLRRELDRVRQPPVFYIGFRRGNRRCQVFRKHSLSRSLLSLVENSDRIRQALHRLLLYWSDFRYTSF